MRFFGDYHTHTRYSDGSGSIRDMVESAIQKGFKQIAITDHGFLKNGLSLTHNKFKRQRKAIEKIRTEYPEIEILHGMEANIIDFSGTVELKQSEIEMLDVFVLGYHRFVFSTSINDFFNYVIYNGFISRFKKPTAKQIAKNTTAYIKALEKYPVDIIAHINQYAIVDAKMVAKVASEQGTYVELNMKHFDLIESTIEDFLQTDCTFIVNSDAHSKKAVGEFDKVFELIEKYNIPEERFANLNKVPIFKNRKNE